jgi:serine/threonine-protein kinase
MSKDANRLVTFKSILDVAADDSVHSETNVVQERELNSLPPGLRRGDDPNVFIYELPNGDSLEMVLIEKGDFLQGPKSLPGYPSVEDLQQLERQASRSSLTYDFYIGRYPVLWRQFEAFCRARSRKVPAKPSWLPAPTHPIVNVTLADAEVFCKWAGLELPSELEWEKAARGTDGRLFPWGRLPLCAADTVRHNAPPVAVPDPSMASPYGVEQAVGGVWEITRDWLESDTPTNAGRYRVLRGAAYKADPVAATVLSRHRVLPDFPREEIGFRTVLRVEPSVSAPSDEWISQVLSEAEETPAAPTIPVAALTVSEQAVARVLFQACDDSLSEASLEVVRRTIGAHPECVSWVDETGYTPLLTVAAKFPYFEAPYRIARLLVDAGADVNARSPEGSTPLHMLAVYPQMFALELAEILLRRGADPTIADNRGRNVLMVAELYAAMGLGDGLVAMLSKHRDTNRAAREAVSPEVAEWLLTLDSSLTVTTLFDNDRREEWDLSELMSHAKEVQDRLALLSRIVERYQEGAVEYVVVNLRLASLDSSEYEPVLAALVAYQDLEFTTDEALIQERWRLWWNENRRNAPYSALSWRGYSPRLAAAADALFSDTVDRIPTGADDLVRLGLARNPSVGPEVMMALTRAPEAYIRIWLATAGTTPTGILSVLAKDHNSGVRRWVAANPNSDDATLELLSKDESEKVRAFLKQNQRLR